MVGITRSKVIVFIGGIFLYGKRSLMNISILVSENLKMGLRWRLHMIRIFILSIGRRPNFCTYISTYRTLLKQVSSQRYGLPGVLWRIILSLWVAQSILLIWSKLSFESGHKQCTYLWTIAALAARRQVIGFQLVNMLAWVFFLKWNDLEIGHLDLLHSCKHQELL